MDDYNPIEVQGCSELSTFIFHHPKATFIIYHPKSAFILYHPMAKGTKERITYSTEAGRILSISASSPKNRLPPSPDLSFLCSRWRGLLDKRSAHAGCPKKEGRYCFIDFHMTQRRRYEIRGIALSDYNPSSLKEIREYMFILEEDRTEDGILFDLLKDLNLNRREKEIVRLLIAGQGNKEMAHHLGISLNTVKGYIKLLMRKLGVNSRVEILIYLFTGRKPLL